MISDENACRSYIIDTLSRSETRISPGKLIKKLSEKTGISFNYAKKIIKDLTDKGEIAYTYVFGSTYIELSFSGQVHITEHFTLTPPGLWSNNPDENENQDKSGLKTDKKLKIIIDPGVSFGSGRHPTTKLCLEAMEQVFFRKKFLNADNKLKALDIGTGSGVLAIAAVKAGIKECFAVDTDPNAVCEAKRNVKLNMLENKIKVTEREITGSQNKKFSLICANLRLPTLKSLAALFSDIARDDCILVISGVRIWEKNQLMDFYSGYGFKCRWYKSSKKWSGFIFFR